MRRPAALAFLLLATSAVADVAPLPLKDALAEAKSSGRLILLYAAGSRGDRQSDEWFAHLDSHEALRAVLPDFVVARAQAAAAAGMLPDLVPYRKQRSPHLLVLDQAGGFLFDLDFREYGDFASELSEIRRQTPMFAASVKAAEAGHAAQALLLRANGILYAGDKPAELFDRVIAMAGDDRALVQEARIGQATIAERRGYGTDATRLLREVAESPARPDIGARAWLLLGHELRDYNDKAGAVAAFQKAYAIAPPPSVYGVAARRFLEMLGSAPEAEVQAAVAAGAVRLLYPHNAILAGDVQVTAAAPPAASRVEIFLDDARVAELTRAPFVAKVPLGAVPRVHTIKAVAYDAKDTVLGEDSATVNERSNALSVEIVAPRDTAVESATIVEVRARVPDGGRVEAVDVYWNQQKVATLTKPPYRTELTLPSKGAFGYIRAVARDANGATAEDAKVINGAGAADVMRVDAVELHAIVQDRDGHSVGGLTAKDFVVKEDGVPVTIEVHGGENEPITVGLAVDASNSMRNAMASVLEYAQEFLRRSLSPDDQTFVVSFAESPVLYQPLTSDLERVGASLFNMRATGRTALWDAIIFSLDQLRAVPGKRALLLFTDGVDTGSRAGDAAARQYAQEIGVPVYVVLIYTAPQPIFHADHGIGTVQTLSPEMRFAALKKLADTSGGAFIVHPRQNDLPKLFQQVRDDTRGAYALTFVSRSTRPRTEPRKLSVAVPGRRGLVVRAPAAYYPR